MGDSAYIMHGYSAPPTPPDHARQPLLTYVGVVGVQGDRWEIRVPPSSRPEHSREEEHIEGKTAGGLQGVNGHTSLSDGDCGRQELQNFATK